MERYELQRLRDLPIEGVAERLGLQITRHKCLCPFHDDTHPSLSFNLRKNTFRCFVCGEHGGVIDIVMRLLGVDFKGACSWLGTGTSTSSSPSSSTSSSTSFTPKKYAKYFDHPYLSDAARRFLFGERLLDERVVRWCRLTSWRDRNGTDWLQVPYYDMEGNLIGVQWRNLTDSLPRFRFPYGSRCSIYNLPVLKMLGHGEDLWITEGCSDCWAMLSAGHKAIAIPSATLLKPKDAELLASLSSTFRMYPDNDVPGERLFLQLQELLEAPSDSPSFQEKSGKRLCHHQLPPGCKDFSDYYIQQKRKEADYG